MLRGLDGGSQRRFAHHDFFQMGIDILAIAHALQPHCRTEELRNR
jgi:hypothetical protein